jgi:ketosteroid isomerase-like protein
MKKLLLIITLLVPILNMAQSSSKKTLIQGDKKITERFLQSFADAFNAHDLKAIMSAMIDDCIFEASAGPEMDGEKFSGQEEVRKAFANVFAAFHDAHWGNARHFISGNRGFSEWIFTGTKSDGTRVEVTGCDLFTFRNGKIAIKNSYRKTRTITQK